MTDPVPETSPSPEPPPSEFSASAALLRRGLTGESSLVGISGVALLLVVRYHMSAATELGLVRPEWDLFGWAGIHIVFLLGVPILILKLFARRKLSDYGLTMGEWRVWLRHAAIYLAVVLPVIAIASRFHAFRAYYPMFELARHRPILLIPWELTYGAYFFAWEFFFRGFLLQGLRKQFGAAAIVIQAIPFVMMHFGKVESEAVASIIAGLALGVTAYRSRSVMGCWLVHWICAAAMDILAML